MNIACISCPARYAVPDAKLSGKRVRIRCKRCGATLLVDGTVSPPRVASADGAGSSVPPARTSLQPLRSRPPEPAQAVSFLVNFADGHQEHADVAQIVRLYRDRRIDAEALVWKDGMEEWATPWDVPEIRAAFQRMGYAPPTAPSAADDEGADEDRTHVAPSSRPGARALFDDDEATHVVDSSRFAAESEAALRAQAEFRATGEMDDDPTHVVSSPIDPAAVQPTRRAATRVRSEQRRRSDAPARAELAAAEQASGRARTREAHARRAEPEGLDLFEARARAEQDLQPAVDDGAHLTGARSENSVLFSLDQLVQKERQAQRPLVLPQRARTDESVLVDSSPSLPSGVGGLGLAAPDFTAPISAPPPAALRPVTEEFEPPRRRSRGWLGILVFLALCGAAGFAYSSGRLDPLLVRAGLKPPEPSAEPTAEPVAEPESEPAAEPSAEPGASAEPSASASASASAAPDAAPPPAPVAGRSPPKESGSKRPSGESGAETKADKASDEQAAKPSGGPFDTGAARATLAAAAGKTGSCRSPGGATGTGRVTITFATSGRPTSVAVSGDLAGTPVGSCVAKLFRGTSVPPFSGDPVTVSKTFSVQ